MAGRDRGGRGRGDHGRGGNDRGRGYGDDGGFRGGREDAMEGLCRFFRQCFVTKLSNKTPRSHHSRSQCRGYKNRGFLPEEYLIRRPARCRSART